MFSESPGDPLSELSLIEHKRTRIDREVDRLLGQLAQPAGGSRRGKRIRRKLRRLTGIRSRLDDEEAELRRRESDLLRIAGSTASSSHETGVEEHAGEVRSSEPVGTSADLSKFEALALNDTPHITESADRLVMHADTVVSGVFDPTIGDPSVPERKKPSNWPYANGFEAVKFCQENPEVAWDILMFCLCGAVGQNFIFLTISRFGSLTNTTITTTRKFMSIVISSVISGNPLSLEQWGSVVMVFSGLSLQIYLKWKRKKGGEHKE